GSAAAEPEKPKPPKPAVLKVSGYGLLGNRELTRVLRTVELSGRKPQYFGPDFIEDAALILSARVKSDGYLQPAVSIRITLSDGREINVEAAALPQNPLVRPLRATRVQFRIRKGVLYYYQSIQFDGLKSISPQQASSYFSETDTLLNLKRSRIYTPERLK